MRVNLNVPFSEKDSARRLGARWDAARRTWFVQDLADLSPFLKWMPSHLRKSHKPVQVRSHPGEQYSPLPCERHCKTPPWDDCANCEHWLAYQDERISAAAEKYTGEFPKL